MVALGDEAQVEARFGRFEHSAWFASSVPLAQKLFCTHPKELLGDVGHVESQFFLFGDSVSVGAG